MLESLLIIFSFWLGVAVSYIGNWNAKFRKERLLYINRTYSKPRRRLRSLGKVRLVGRGYRST